MFLKHNSHLKSILIRYIFPCTAGDLAGVLSARYVRVERHVLRGVRAGRAARPQARTARVADTPTCYQWYVSKDDTVYVNVLK